MSGLTGHDEWLRRGVLEVLDVLLRELHEEEASRRAANGRTNHAGKDDFPHARIHLRQQPRSRYNRHQQQRAKRLVWHLDVCARAKTELLRRQTTCRRSRNLYCSGSAEWNNLSRASMRNAIRRLQIMKIAGTRC